jgi:hypothetical protein
MPVSQASRHAHIKELKAESWTNVWVLEFNRTAKRKCFEQIRKLLDHPMVGIFG